MKQKLHLIASKLLELARKISLRAVVFGVVTIITVSFAYVTLSTYGNPVPDKLAREKQNTANNIVNDVTELNPIEVIDIIVPHSEAEIMEAVRTHDRVSIGGGRNSMGGQTASERAVQIDMREYNKILSLSTSSKEITVQSGIRWRDIQDYIDPYNLSVKIMQTYANFTVGGSLSVNVHGRYVGLGPVIMSVKSFRIVLANGSVIVASPTLNPHIFYSAIGGMGGIGVITDVTLSLADNVNVERVRKKVATDDYTNYFKTEVRANPGTVFHNGDIYPPHFERVSAVSWVETDREPTTEDRLIPREKDYWKERIAWVVMSEWPFGRWIREHIIDPILYSGTAPVHTRNYEASYDIAELEPSSRYGETYVLQEYFVPVEKFDEWIPKMKRVFNDNNVNVINVSIRHAEADPGAKLAWARTESFAFVVYYKQGTDEEAKDHVAKWTREMIDEVLSVDGTYYLPYQIHATDDQIHQAYPGLVDYFEIKKAYDPKNKFTNKLWDTYYSDEKLEKYQEQKRLEVFRSQIPDYHRAFDNAYLSIPEWYIVYSAGEYATVLAEAFPSDFSYLGANRDYWDQYDIVTRRTATSTHDNTDYLTVLNVIGWSFSVENAIKGVYENVIGRLSELINGPTPTAEDIYAAKVAREYADFIYDYPWYDFPYFSSLVGLWQLDTSSNSLRQRVRALERKTFLTLEYGIKSLYANAIAFATHTKFGVQDDVIYALISRDNGVTKEVISAPHYQPFTRRLLSLLETETLNPGLRIFDISGNEHITFTYLDSVGSSPVSYTSLIARDTEIVGFEGNKPLYKDRLTVEVAMADIPRVYAQLSAAGLIIDHFYDY